MKNITKKSADHFVRACRKKGLKATNQRREIMRELLKTKEHPDAETIFRKVRKRLPAISLDTVYRTLRVFEDNGDVFRVATFNDRARYDANTSRHHHFICTNCGRIVDCRYPVLDRFKVPPELALLGRVDRVHIEFRGLCSNCRALGFARQ